ncbi:hypothetical protein Tco_0236116 [Tanacetum coccineum]
MTSRCSNNIKESLFLKHGLISRTYSKKSLIMVSTFGSKSKSFMTMLILPQDEPSSIGTGLGKLRTETAEESGARYYEDHSPTYDNEKFDDPRDFCETVKAIMWKTKGGRGIVLRVLDSARDTGYDIGLSLVGQETQPAIMCVSRGTRHYDVEFLYDTRVSPGLTRDARG